MRKISVLAFCIALSASLPTWAQTQMQFPTTPWQGYAPARVQCGSAFGVSLATTGADVVIPISTPSVLNGGGSYVVEKVVYSNANVSLSSANAGIFTAAGATGVTVVSNGALSTLTAAALNAAGSAYMPTIAAATEAFNLSQLYLNIGTGQSGATMDVRIFCSTLYGSASNPH